jgi:hypothetical protein
MERDELSPTPEDLDFHGVTSRYAEIEGVTLEPSVVPESIRHLIPLAKYWSIGDDVERADMMWLTPYADLKAMVLAVLPFADVIGKWCSSHHADIPVPDEVVVFDMLTEAAAEAEALHVDVEGD